MAANAPISRKPAHFERDRADLRIALAPLVRPKALPLAEDPITPRPGRSDDLEAYMRALADIIREHKARIDGLTERLDRAERETA